MKTNTELERLEDMLFLLEMQDRWTSEDYRRYDELNRKIREIKGVL